MNQDLRQFINNQDNNLRPLLIKYYNLYLHVEADGNTQNASEFVLNFYKRATSSPNRDLEIEVLHAIEMLELASKSEGKGIKRKRQSKKKSNKKSNKKSKKSKKSRKSRK